MPTALRIGGNPSSAIEVTIEIPKDQRNKYQIDHATGRVHLDRYLYTSMGYPADYGFIENTLGEDGDPLDAVVLSPAPLFPGVILSARPVRCRGQRLLLKGCSDGCGL